MTKPMWVALVGAVAIVGVVTIPALCQQGGPLGGDAEMLAAAGAMPGGMGGPPPMMRPPSATLMAADGVVYVACEGKLTAYEAKTLRKLAETTYWEPVRWAQ